MPRNLSAWNSRYEGQPEAALQFALSGAAGTIAMVSSFGADSAVLLHMVAQIDRAAPVLFIDTLMLFQETLSYQSTLARHLGLTNVRVIQPDREALFRHDPDAVLHRANPDACCDLRKTQALDHALTGFDGWITGRKRFQNGQRAVMPLFEHDGDRLKVNPLAGWSTADITAYLDCHALPRHPLVARGYPSIGCAPCTSPVAPGEDPRAGRWRGQDKTECGIHIVNGAITRKHAS